MNLSMRSLLLATAISTLSLSAVQAEDMASAGNYYVGGGILGNIVSDNDIDGPNFSSEAEADNGLGGILTFGYDYDSPWRGELEFGGRKNDIDKIGGVGVSGDAAVYSGMINALYDFDTNSAFTPYLGAGLGLAYGDVSIDSNVNGSSVNESDTALAAQFIAGASYAMSSNLDLVGQYNLLTTPGDFEYKTAAGQSVDYKYTAHSIMIGLRYSFGAPAPVVAEEPVMTPVAAIAEPVVEPTPVPAPVEEPAKIVRSFLVFFDWDSDTLTPEAMAILSAAADNAKTGKVVSIDLTGHADTSGKKNYNMKLSNRRANIVKNELMRLGVTDADIMTIAKGEAAPLVSTGDGVREPQNRRVEIMFD